MAAEAARLAPLPTHSTECPIFARVTVVVVTACLFIGIAWLAEVRQPVLLRIAADLGGEQWYRIEMGADHVGFMYNNAYRDHQGDWHFDSTTHFLLQENAPNTLTKQLTFASVSPYPLLQATYTERQGNTRREVRLQRSVEGYVATISNTDETRRTPMALPWQYGLGDFLAFEQWLETMQPSPGAQFVVASPDFEKLRMERRTYTVVAHQSGGYLVENNAPFAASRTQLDKNLRPQQLSMAGLFQVTASNEADAIALTHLRRKTQYRFAVDSRLPDHTNLSRLHLRLLGAEHLQLPQEFLLTHNPLSDPSDADEVQHFRGAALRFPITHPRIQRLAQRSVQAQPMDSIRQLLATTRQQLVYTENQPAGSVIAALESGQGECTDFADLFTTLVRAAGFPARTVYGLAYADATAPAFMFHAWSEVYVEGAWLAVDPTWDQLRVDASHVPLTESEAALLMLANNTAELRFQVIGQDYF